MVKKVQEGSIRFQKVQEVSKRLNSIRFNKVQKGSRRFKNVHDGR